jgi:hypothetical protein
MRFIRRRVFKNTSMFHPYSRDFGKDAMQFRVFVTKKYDKRVSK